eukprot:gene5357-5384_t
MSSMVTASSFYARYDGHPVRDLDAVLRGLHAQGKSSIVFLAGDSTLDNKYWFRDQVPAVNGYEHILVPPTSKPDVAYHLNDLLRRQPDLNMACLNTAVEASSLNSRACGKLTPQDRFIHDHISEQDVLVVSIGGNDIALQPLMCTAMSMLALVYCSGPTACISRGCACPPNTGALGDLGCLCCGVPNCLTSLMFGCPIGLSYMVDMFGNRTENYIRHLLGRRKPRKVVVCMLYFLDQNRTGSWADGALGCLCYDCKPRRLQTGMEAVFRLATQRIQIPGVEVVAYPLFKVLDGTDTTDYRERVEPSPSGGGKMARGLLDAIIGT